MELFKEHWYYIFLNGLVKPKSKSSQSGEAAQAIWNSHLTIVYPIVDHRAMGYNISQGGF